MKIFEVSITKTIYVQAETERGAELEAATYESEEDGDIHVEREITSLNELPDDWKDAFPYGGDGEMSLRELLTPPDPPPPPFVDPPEQLRIFPERGQPA